MIALVYYFVAACALNGNGTLPDCAQSEGSPGAFNSFVLQNRLALKPGDTAEVRGIFPASAWNVPGTIEKPITIRGFDCAKDGFKSPLPQDGTWAEPAFTVLASHVVVENISVESCSTKQECGQGLHFGWANAYVENVTARGVLVKAAKSGLVAENSYGLRIVENVVEGVGYGSGVYLGMQNVNATIERNVATGARNRNSCFALRAKNWGHTIRDNVCTNFNHGVIWDADEIDDYQTGGTRDVTVEHNTFVATSVVACVNDDYCSTGGLQCVEGASNSRFVENVVYGPFANLSTINNDCMGAPGLEVDRNVYVTPLVPRWLVWTPEGPKHIYNRVAWIDLTHWDEHSIVQGE